MPEYQARAYYQQNISSPHSYKAEAFTSKKAALAWAKAYPDCFLAEIWQGRALRVQQSRYYRKTWKHHRVD